jgi:hypothetical protein
MNSRGLGDSIEKITEATGIKKIVETLEEKFDFDCGCDKRKELLNKLFPYKFECLTEDEFKSLENFDWRDDRITMEDKIILLKIYNRVFNQNFGMTTCNSCWVKYIADLKKLYNVYKDEKNN